MTQGNDYLLDPAVQQQLQAHDQDLLAQSVPPWPLGAPQPASIVVFNRKREAELLKIYADNFTDIDFRDGNVTVDDAAQATYGTADEYFTDRIVKTWLKPDSGFNKEQADGHVLVVGPDGQHIIRNTRRSAAADLVQTRSDHMERALARKAVTVAKPVKAAINRAERIAPGSKADMQAIARGAADNVARETYRALGQGE